jgi:GYF domain 2
MLDKFSMFPHHAKLMIFHVAREGEVIGEFSESTFQEKIFAGEIRPGDHYWTEGLPDWRLVSQYRILAKTVRMSAEPPPISAESDRPSPSSAPVAPRKAPADKRGAGSRMVTAGVMICFIGGTVAVVGAATNTERIGLPGVILLALGSILIVCGRWQN